MAGKTSYYSRIEAILEVSGGHKFGSIDDLHRQIVDRRLQAFIIHRWDGDAKEVRPYCSEGSVAKAIELAVSLGLIDEESGRLSSVGQEAADANRFPAVVRRQVSAQLRREGIPMSQVNTAAKGMLQGSAVVLPTLDDIYSRVSKKAALGISVTKFKTLLRLMADCEGITISRRHILVPR